MLSTAIIVFRETLEIAMILGVILAATRNLQHRLAWIIGGFSAGAFGAGLVAVFAGTISASLSGSGQEVFNACILFAAALMIGGTVVWMRTHARQMVQHMRQVGHDVIHGTLPHYTLGIIVSLTLLREGSEIVLFVYGMMLSGQGAASIVGGCTVGILLGALMGTLIYYGMLKIPARHVLSVTSWLLIVLVAGLTAQGIGFLTAAGYFADYSHPLWNTSWLLSEDSIVGKSLHSLVGYTARPTSAQLTAYLLTLAGLCATIYGMERGKKTPAVAVAAAVLLFLGMGSPSSAYAIDHFYSPIVVKGELEFEYVGNRTFDNASDKNNVQGHEVELEYGLTDRIKTIIAGSWEKNPGESRKLDASQLESVFQFTPQGEYWLDSGLLVAYGLASQHQHPDFVETKLLLQKDVGKFTHLVNIGLEQNIGRHSGGTGGPEYSAQLSSSYRASEYVQPALEIHSELGHGHTLGRFNQQGNYVGPALYGDLPINGLKYEVAYVFGVSDAAANGAARVMIEYELYF